MFSFFSKIQNAIEQKQKNVSDICDSFPRGMKDDVLAVCKIIAKKTFNKHNVVLSANKNEYKLLNEGVTVPYRVFVGELEDNEISRLTDTQKLILYCIYTRNYNDYKKEKKLK